MTPLVSVIIPTYNRANLLKHAVDSVLTQTYPYFEIIIIDDGSTDHTSDVVAQKKDPRIRYEQQSASGLPAAARNHGIRIARGAFIAFLDSDDLWLPNKLERQIALAQSHPDVGLFYGIAETFGSESSESTVPVTMMRSGTIFEDLLFFNFIPTLTALIPRSVFDVVGVFEERPEFKAIEDYDLWLRIAQRYTVLRSDKVLARYRKHPITLMMNLPNSYGRQEMVLKKIFHQFKVAPSLQKKVYAHLSLAQFRQEIQKQHLEGVHPYERLKKVFDLNPWNWEARFYQLICLLIGVSGLRLLVKAKKYISKGISR